MAQMQRTCALQASTSYFKQIQWHIDVLAKKFETLDQSRQFASEVDPADQRKSIDEVLPASEKFASQRNATVELNLEGTELAPLTVPSLFYNSLKCFDDRTALAFRVGAQGNAELSYEGYYLETLNAAHSFITLGLNQNESVAFACYNAPTLFIGALGAIFAGGVYTDMCHLKSKATFIHIMQDSKASFVMVDTHKKINEILDSWNELPHLKAIIQVDPSQMNNPQKNVFTWLEFIQLGKGSPEAELSRRLTVQAPNKCCAVLYSSDRSVGRHKPRGAMLSHDNITYMARILRETACPDNDWQRHSLRFVSYLPLCWPLGLIFEIFMPMTMGAAVFFAEPDACQGTLVSSLRAVQPDFFMASNRMWTMLHNRVEKRARRLSWLRRSVLKLAQALHLKTIYSRILRDEKPHIVPPKRAIRIITKNVKRKLGLEHAKLFLSFGGPLHLDTLEFFLGLDIPICEVYDSSLFAGVHSMNSLHSYQMGSVGTELPGCMSKLMGDDNYNDGRLFVNGRHLCMGTLHKPNVSSDEDGFVYPGVIAYRHFTGSLYLTGTTTDLLVLCDGSMVICEPLERMFKECLPIVSNCVIVGHHQPFVSILITLKTELDLNTLRPQNMLIKPVQKWIRNMGSRFYTVTEVLASTHNIVFEAIEDTIVHINKQLGHHNAAIKAWKLLPTDFTIIDGEIDPTTMDVNREVILQHYKSVIDDIYSRF